MRNALETRDLDYLLAVEEQGSIGRAADLLGITQPALTKAIKRIETHLGLPLFERTSKGMKTLDAGKAFLARARRIQLEYGDAIMEMHAMKTGEQGVLRLGFSPSIPSSMMMGPCRQLLRERPVARFVFRQRLARDLLDLLQAGELDMVIAPIPCELAEELDALNLYNDRLWIVADEDHSLHKLQALSLRDLSSQEWILPARHILVRKLIDSAFVEQGLPPPALRVETDFGTASILQLIRGTSLLSVTGMNWSSTLTGLRPLNIPTEELNLKRRIGVIHRAGAYMSPLAKRLIELFQAHVA